MYRDGQFSGQALVVVPQKQVEVAVLQMHGMMMGRRYIEAFPASRWDYYNAIKAVPSDGDAAIPSRDRSANPPQQQPKEVGDCKILKLRGKHVRDERNKTALDTIVIASAVVSDSRSLSLSLLCFALFRSSLRNALGDHRAGCCRLVQ